MVREVGRGKPVAAVRGDGHRHHRLRGDRPVGGQHRRSTANSLFWVILISLSLSWVSSITVTPLLSYLFFKPIAGGACRQQRSVRRPARSGCTGSCWRWRSASAGRWWSFAIVAFVAALYGFTKVEQSFFPPATRPQFMVDVFLPAGTHIRETEAFAGDVQQLHPGAARRHTRHVVHRRRRLAVHARLLAGTGEPGLRAVPGRCR